MTKVREWLPHEGKIWVDESATAVATGIASEDVVNRLATAPRFWRANQRWRLLVSIVLIGLAALTAVLYGKNRELNIAIHTQTALRLNTEAQAILSGSRTGSLMMGLLKLLTAHRIAPHREIEDAVLAQVVVFDHVRRILENGAPVGRVAFSPDMSLLVSGGEDHMIRLWDVETGQAIGAPLKGHEGPVTRVAFSPDGKRLVSASEDQTLRLWDVQTGRALGAPLKGHEGRVTDVAFSPDGTRLASASSSYDETIGLWDAVTGQSLVAPTRGHKAGVTSIDFSPDGLRLASGSSDKMLRLWDAKSGKLLWARSNGKPGRLVGLVGNNTRSEQIVFMGFLGLAFSPDGTHLVSWDDEHTLRLWDVKAGRALGAPLQGHEGPVTSVAFSPDGTRLVSGSEDQTLRLWDVQTGRPLGNPLREDSGGVLSVAFSPDGRRLASGSSAHKLRLWDAETGQRIGAPLEGQGEMQKLMGLVHSVAFSPNSTYLVSGSGDKMLRLWNVQTGQPLGEPLRGHKGQVKSVAFSPDGTHFVSGGDDHMLRLWPAPKVWPDLLCAKLTRNMSHKEWREQVSSDIDYIEQCAGLPIPSDEPEQQSTASGT